MADIADGRVKRGWLTSDELDALPRVLQEGEALTTIAEGSKGWRRGLIVATDRRLLFLYSDRVLVDIGYGDVTSFRVLEPSFLSDVRLVIEARDIEAVLEPDAQAARVNELVDAIEAHIAGAA